MATSDRVLVINEGKLLADSPVSELVAKARAAGRDVETSVLDIVRSGGKS